MDVLHTGCWATNLVEQHTYFGTPKDDEVYQLTHSEADQLNAQFPGKPLCLDHDDSLVVGTLQRGWREGNSAYYTAKLDDTPVAKWADLDALRSRAKACSLKHVVYPDGRLEVKELSLCKEPMRPGARVMARIGPQGVVTIQASKTTMKTGDYKQQPHVVLTSQPVEPRKPRKAAMDAVVVDGVTYVRKSQQAEETPAAAQPKAAGTGESLGKRKLDDAKEEEEKGKAEAQSSKSRRVEGQADAKTEPVKLDISKDLIHKLGSDKLAIGRDDRDAVLKTISVALSAEKELAAAKQELEQHRENARRLAEIDKAMSQRVADAVAERFGVQDATGLMDALAKTPDKALHEQLVRVVAAGATGKRASAPVETVRSSASDLVSKVLMQMEHANSAISTVDKAHMARHGVTVGAVAQQGHAGASPAAPTYLRLINPQTGEAYMVPAGSVQQGQGARTVAAGAGSNQTTRPQSMLEQLPKEMQAIMLGKSKDVPVGRTFLGERTI